MDQFLETHDLTRLTQEETDDLNRPTSIKSIINNRKHQAQMASLVKYNKHLRKKLYQFFALSFKKIEGIGTLTNSFSEARTR